MNVLCQKKAISHKNAPQQAQGGQNGGDGDALSRDFRPERINTYWQVFKGDMRTASEYTVVLLLFYNAL